MCMHDLTQLMRHICGTSLRVSHGCLSRTAASDMLRCGGYIQLLAGANSCVPLHMYLLIVGDSRAFKLSSVGSRQDFMYVINSIIISWCCSRVSRAVQTRNNDLPFLRTHSYAAAGSGSSHKDT